ncbi:MAG: hypothetical protein KC897_08120, partial [Candidatus Omnitrophica bacterium]|nr:hypothetical protein [Candidatus Omnitrophota bacterium]
DAMVAGLPKCGEGDILAFIGYFSPFSGIFPDRGFFLGSHILFANGIYINYTNFIQFPTVTALKSP